jgi:hypothetical protein
MRASAFVMLVLLRAAYASAQGSPTDLSLRVEVTVTAQPAFEAASQRVPLAGIDDVHTHPALPRTVRLALRVTF